MMIKSALRPATWLLASGFVFALGTMSPAHADSLPAKGKLFSDWIVDCEKPADKKEICFLSQEQRTKEKNERVVKMSIGKFGPKEEMMMVTILPLGIAVQVGAALKVDAKDQVNMVVQQCTGEGCVATMMLDKSMVDGLRSAHDIKVGIMPFGGSQTVVIALSSIGLNEAMKAMHY